MLYDKNGAVYTLDHEHDGTAYVRPMVKVVTQATGYNGDSFHEEEDYEPASYLISMDRSELFNSPPIEEVNEDLASKKAELAALKADAEREIREINAERSAIKSDLRHAKHQLDMWMGKHRVMMDLGKLLDGQILYPLSVRKNSYHHSREIPYIPKMERLDLLTVSAGDFEKGQKWTIKKYSSDSYGNPFRFFDTEEERSAVISSEFDEVCEAFRKKPNFETAGYTTTTSLNYGTLMKWVKTHPALTIPADIEAMKDENDAKVVEDKKAALKAQLEELSA